MPKYELRRVETEDANCAANSSCDTGDCSSNSKSRLELVRIKKEVILTRSTTIVTKHSEPDPPPVYDVDLSMDAVAGAGQVSNLCAVVTHLSK